MVRRLLAASLFAALLAVPSVVLAGGPANGEMKAHNVVFRTSKAAAVLGSSDTDSLVISMNGAVQTKDTSLVIPLANFDIFSTALAAMTTAYDVGKIVFNSAGTAASVDSLFYTIDVSWDGGSNWVAGTEVSVLPANADDETIAGRLTVDADAVANIWGAPLMRIRVRPDGNTAAIFPSASVKIFYWPIDPNK